MSIRAYKLIKIEHNENMSFNVSHNNEFVEQYFQRNEGGDVLYIEKDDGLEMLERDVDSGDVIGMDLQEAREVLKTIKNDMGDMNYVEYYCY